MGVPTSALEAFRKSLADALVLTTDSVMAPLDRIHKIHRIGIDAKSQQIPLGSGFSMTAATAGTVSEAGTIVNTIGEVTVTPTPYKVSVDVAKADILGNPIYFDQFLEGFAEAMHEQTMTLLQAQYEDTAVLELLAEIPLTASGIITARQSLAASGIRGPYACVLSPKSVGDLLFDLGSNYSATQVASDAMFGSFYNVAGVLIYEDSNIGIDANAGGTATGYRNFMGPQNAVHIVYRGEPEVNILERDGVNVNVVANYWVACESVSNTRHRVLRNN